MVKDQNKNLAIFGGPKTLNEQLQYKIKWDENDNEHVLQLLRTLGWGRRIGRPNERVTAEADCWVQRLENRFINLHKSKYALCVSSCTTGLELICEAIGIGPGDEVIVPAYTFISSASCITRLGGKVIFCDIDEHNLCIDSNKIEDLISPKTKAIMVVHFAGACAPVKSILELANKYQLKVIEDCAQAVGLKDEDGNFVGSQSDAACFSFEASKNISGGEGGIVCVNDKDLYEKIYSLHSCGRHFGGAWYDHPQFGTNARMSALTALLIFLGLNRLDEKNECRRKNAFRLGLELSKIDGIKVFEKDDDSWVPHLFVFSYDNSKWDGLSLKRFVWALNAEGVNCHEGYKRPLYRAKAFKKFGENYLEQMIQNCPKAEELSSKVIWLPATMLDGSEEQNELIAKAINKLKNHLIEFKSKRKNCELTGRVES